MRLLFLGDVVGRSGRDGGRRTLLPGLIAKHRFDFVVVNGENAAGGFGITEEIFQELIAAGADCVTTGNHVWDQREALIFADRYDRFLRPVNYPPGTPGRGANVYAAKNGARVLVVNVMGALFMPALDDPFQAVTREISACAIGNGCDAVVVDMHAEASSEKQTMGYFLDGKASLVIGTHTHVPTADWRILAGGTAYMTDVGMCGDYDSVIGMEKDEPLRRVDDEDRLRPLRAGARAGRRSPGWRSRSTTARASREGSRRSASARACRRPSRISETRHERRRCTAAASAARCGFAASARAVPGLLVPLQGLPPADRRAGGRVGRLPRRGGRVRGRRRSAGAPREHVIALLLRRLRHADHLRARRAARARSTSTPACSTRPTGSSRTATPT